MSGVIVTSTLSRIIYEWISKTTDGGSLVSPDSWGGVQVTHYLFGEVQLPTSQRPLKR